MATSSNEAKPSPDLIPLQAFKAVVWLGVGIMTLVLLLRTYFRVASFRRLLVEDWLMIFALLVFIAIAIISELYIEVLYGASDPPSSPPSNEGVISTGAPGMAVLRALATAAVLYYVGLWTIKVNFLLFFYRMGHHLPKYRIFWWVVFVTVVAIGIIQLGLIKFDCLLADDATKQGYCSTVENLVATRQHFIISVALDVFSDLLMLCFPISILWESGISLRQKMVLSGIFSLIGFTIAVTIIRGGFTTNIDRPSAASELNVSFSFWTTLEYIVSFLVACAISFRSLFTQRRNQAKLYSEQQKQRDRVLSDPTRDHHKQTGGNGVGSKMQDWHDAVLDIYRELERPRAEYLELQEGGILSSNAVRTGNPPAGKQVDESMAGEAQ